MNEKVFKDVEQKYTDDDGNPAVRLVDKVSFHFQLDGYHQLHFSPKMTLSTNEKANLYKFLVQLYGDRLVPGIPIDTFLLKGTRVKTMWADSKYKDKQGNFYQNLVQIRALYPDNLPAIWQVEENEPPHEEETEEETV